MKFNEKSDQSSTLKTQLYILSKKVVDICCIWVYSVILHRSKEQNIQLSGTIYADASMYNTRDDLNMSERYGIV